MPFDTVEKVLRECAAYHPVVDLIGGEPLLYPHLREAVRLASRHEYRKMYERARPMPMCFRCCGLSQTIRFDSQPPVAAPHRALKREPQRKLQVARQRALAGNHPELA
jgi:organic radical activating enzyme